MGTLGNPNIALLEVLLTIFLMIVSFVYCYTNKNINPISKLVLLIGIVCLPIVGALVYWVSALVIIFRKDHSHMR